MKAIELIDKKFLTINGDEHVSKLIGELRTTGEKSAVVVDNKGSYAGISYRRNLIKSRVDPHTIKVKHIVVKAPKLDGSESMERAAYLMFTSSLYMLPIVENGKLIGVIRARSVLDSLKGKLNLSFIAKDFKLYTLSEDSIIADAMNILKQKKIDRLPVIDKNGDLTGVISFSDLLFDYISQLTMASSKGYRPRAMAHTKAFTSNIPRLLDLNVSNFMQKDVVSIHNKVKLTEVYDLIKKKNVDTVIITEGKKPVAVVSVKDLLGVVGR